MSDSANTPLDRFSVGDRVKDEYGTEFIVLRADYDFPGNKRTIPGSWIIVGYPGDLDDDDDFTTTFAPEQLTLVAKARYEEPGDER